MICMLCWGRQAPLFWFWLPWFRVSLSHFRFCGLLLCRCSGLNVFPELHQDHCHVVASFTTSRWWCQAPIENSLTYRRQFVFLHELQSSSVNYKAWDLTLCCHLGSRLQILSKLGRTKSLISHYVDEKHAAFIKFVSFNQWPMKRVTRST